MAVPGYEGFATLGDVVSGGPGARAEEKFPQRLKQNFDAFGALEGARKKRSEAIAAGMMTDNRGRLTQDLVKRAVAGDPDAQAELGAVTMGMAKGQPNFNTFTNGLGDVADMSIDQQRETALKAGDMPQYNRLTALRTDKAYQPARVVQGNILPDGLTLGDEGFDVSPLPQTAATIAQKGAAIEQGERKTAAYVDRQHQPPAPKGKTLTPSQADARMDLILQKGTELAKSGKPDAYVQAWMRDQAERVGLTMAPTDEPMPALGEPVATTGADASAVLPRMDGGGGGGAPLNGSAKPSTLQQGRANSDALRVKADALRAIADGAPKAAVAKRLREMGYPKIAGGL